MAQTILMPALSPTMTEGTLAKWLVNEGDTIESGQAIAEIETDKATMEVEAVEEGVLAKIMVPAGTEAVAVNTVIAVLKEEGDSDDAVAALAGGDAAAPAPAAETPAEDDVAAKGDADDHAEVTPAPAPARGEAPAATAGSDDGDRIKASPLARRMASQAGLDLTGLAGTGPHGRIVKADIEAALADGGAPAAAEVAPAAEAAPTAAPAKAAAAPAAGGGGYSVAAISAAASAQTRDLVDKLGMAHTAEPNNGMRKTIARRLLDAKQTVPHFYLTVDCVIDRLMGVRKELNERGGVKVSVNDFVVRASALSLRKVPAANAAWTDEAILRFHDVDVSVAVAIDGGLITPIIKKADTKGLATISSEMRDLAERARAGKLKPEEYQGGTFSVSNLGMYGIKEFSAIINPPQSAILAVGAAEQRPVVKDGALAVATVMTATLSCDHRVVDGAVGAQFLAAFKKLIEDPLSMLL
ncbi:acetyltransferase component of pyruvate dehydrogenase complex [Tistrella bauzanensis]|uniref:Acetyltransferase component of pyruvate dehydrogenase complex n=1 Tax=Tistrella bauzanensis TaxID=657419 RepID=A0ABQ1IFV4_9PROT|nr:pyruvate dehydrogenase complex dihydrolipoamide acetyltransferase [Tistrella bauzanensis]GGB38563.1 acetyltransferase component of pyruvate dehydrogenase complex [Tistrella bauzanensis]